MMHADVEKGDIVDRYVRRELSFEQQQAFEEHFFGCNDCFARVQDAERLRAGVRDAVRRGVLDAQSPAAFAAPAASWRWAFAAAACATIVFAALTVWLYVSQVPALREALDRNTALLEQERQARAQVMRTPSPIDAPEGNVALVMLVASRAAEKPPTAVLAPAAKRLVVWIEIGPSRYRTFKLDVIAPDNRSVASVEGLARGPYGALVASLPAEKLPSGDLRITLSGQDPPPAALVGDYQLRIEKR